MEQQSVQQICLPLLFEENHGQMDADRHFRARSSYGNFYIHPNAVSTVLIDKTQNLPAIPSALAEEDSVISGVVLALSFVGANGNPAPEGLEPSNTKFHYLKGPDPANWSTHVSTFPKIRYRGIWEGIDLELCGGEAGIKLYWQLDSPQRLSSLHLRWDGGSGLTLEEDGSLLLKHALGEQRDPAPCAWQVIGGKHIPVDCAFRLEDNSAFGFTILGDYDESLPLVIDPLIPYATYLGGNLLTETYAVAVDDQGSAYVTGETASIDFPVTPGAFQVTFQGFTDAYVTKFAPDGASLIYSTFLSGNDYDSGRDISLDNQGNVYIAGATTSPNFPVTPGAFQTISLGSSNAFVSKLAPNGASLVYSTFLGGTKYDSGTGIALDDQGNAYVTGTAQSTDFPVTPGAFQPSLQGNADAFVLKLTPDGGSLIYSSYLGGSNDNYAYSIAVDPQYSAYVTGETSSADFPTTSGAFQTVLLGSLAAFVTKFATDGESLLYSTYLGGSVASSAQAIAVSAQGNAYITGFTYSDDFPITPGAFKTTIAGLPCAFVTAFAADGESLLASTYLGGNDLEALNMGTSIALDSRNRAYLTGYTNAPDFPITPNVIPSSYSGDLDAFVSIFTSDLSTLLVSFYIGGSSDDQGNGIAIGQSGDVYAAGKTYSSDFPATPGAFQTTAHGMSDGFVTRNIVHFIEIKQASLSIIKLS